MYTPIKWQDEYSVGVKELDAQHQNLLNIINTLLIGQQDEYNAIKMSEMISSLIHHAYVHFATEERYLAQSNFPDIKTHVLEHVGFIMKTLELSLKVKEGTNDNRLELLRYLKGWYSSHVLGSDRLLIPYITTERIK
ncbi:MAG: hemerythrin family protein [Ignavibacteriales bacterium]|nr:hemerythrin family protein [Ignavibacteriales bacterium]